jgi:arsenate reductase (glutaredoxin)
MSVTIYHNPRCSKSRQTLALLEERGIEPDVVLYLETPPTFATLDALLKSLGMEPRALMRKGEEAYKSLNLADSVRTRQELIEAMVAHPILIERPIVTHGDRAALGRPPEQVLQIL